MRRLRPLLLLLFTALIAVAILRSSPPRLAEAAGPAASPEFRPKVWDFPGHNFW